MVSFDAIPLFHDYSYLLRRRWKELYGAWTRIDGQLFFEILTFCLDKSYCQFEGCLYAQTEGSPIGSPLSPVLADIVLDELYHLIKNL